jgi:TPR repeat protein
MTISAFDLASADATKTGVDPDALYDLGMMYAAGRSVPVDLVAAHKWFNLAALKGRRDAVGLRRELAELMSDVEIAMAQREARIWMTAH